MQVGFIDVVCLPLYKVLAETFPWVAPLLEGTEENRANWQDLAEKVEMGLTWIDHDTIDKPIEGFSGNLKVFERTFLKLMKISHFSENAEDLKEIDLTITTLNCQNNDAIDQQSPLFERRPRFSSLKKSTGLPKAVRNRLNMIKLNQSSEKSSMDEVTKEIEKDSTVPPKATSADPITADKNSKSIEKVSKKHSKMCLLL